MVDDVQLGDFLLTAGLVSRRQLEDVFGLVRQSSPQDTQVVRLRESQARRGKTLSDVLVEQGIVGADDVRRASAHMLGIPFVVLGRDDISLEALVLIPEPLSRTHNIVAYRADDPDASVGAGGVLEVALLDIANLGAVDFLRQKHKIKARLTTGDSIKQALLIYQKHLKEKFAGMIEKGAGAADSLLRHALLSHASHIHIEPALVGTLVRYRINGMLHEAMRLPEEAGAFIVEKIKSLAKLFPVATAVQEGRFKFEHAGETVAVSVSTLPIAGPFDSAQGKEKVLLRLARERLGQKGFTLHALGFHGESLECLHEALERRSGLVLVCGPAGAGKTTTLYTLLDFLNEPGVALATIEEKIEYRLLHVAQTPVRSDIGLSTLAGLRALLRQDLDIVMVGNIDTEEVATLASSVAQRGVFVLAGAQDVSLVPDATVTIFLELMQKLCQHCKKPYTPTRAEFAALEENGASFGRVLAALKEEEIVGKKLAWKDLTFYRARAVGCEHCEGGYLPAQAGKGMVGIQEVVCPNYQGLSLLEDALFKAAQGLVSIEDLLRASSE
ncbi:MAG: ATPase, T2SS/T4P/T4SS family [bacterium]|nr:ATPase, T2SS/T4P/T4SS family [bacterium]